LSLEWLYTFDELRAYSVDTKQGKLRLGSTIKHMPDLLETAGISLPENPKVLCLMAGSCIEGLAFAQLYKAEVTCLDVQKRMLLKGVREAKRRKLRLKTVVADAKELTKKVKGTFDLVTILGSPLAHLGISDFDGVVTQVKEVLHRKGTFLVEQSDMVFRIMPYYGDAMVPNVNPPVINVHISFNPKEGYFERLLFGRNKQEVSRVFLWGPWIIEYVLKKNGFSSVEVNPYADPYLTVQPFLFTARSSWRIV